MLEADRDKRVTSPLAGATTKSPYAAMPRHLEDLLAAGEARFPVDEIVEAAIAWAGEVLGEGEIVVAREDFFVKAGKVFHDDPFYDARISYFIEHFLFERPIAGIGRAQSLTGMVPFQLFVRHAVEPSGIAEHAKVLVASLAQARHSLFRVEKVQGAGLVLRDLLIPQKVEIAAKRDESYRAFDKGTLLQGFVYRLPSTCHLGAGLVIHPARATGMIKKHLEHARNSGSTAEGPLLCKLATLQLRHLRHRHVDAKSIYSIS